MKRFLAIFCVCFVSVLLVKSFLYWQNQTAGVTEYTVVSAELPEAFDGYKIVLLTDIQGAKLVTDKRFIRKIENAHPDMLVLAGDLTDENIAGSDEKVDFILSNYPLPKALYAVSGNHDLWTGRFAQLKAHWESISGITFLENDRIRVTRDGQSVNLYGISDPESWDAAAANEKVKNAIRLLDTPDDGYNILLFHRANMLDLFKNENFDLILSGHLHGGQIRLPFIGGLRSPHGDWFPKYSGGRYDVNGHTYIVSRGLCNAVKIPRLFNRPEIVVITLKKQ